MPALNRKQSNMRRSIILTLAMLGGALAARAQWVVYDPTMHMQQIMDTARQMAQFVSMVNNQISQIRTLTDQVNEFKHYEDLFGDPSKVLLPAVQPLVNDLDKTELGQTLGAIQTTVTASQAMVYNGAGLFHAIGKTFTTPDGRTVTRPQAPFLPIAAVQETTDNFLAVSADAAARRVALKRQIAAATDQLKAATTDAQVQKLSGVLVGLSAALNNTDYELNQASASALVQEAANRNDAQRQLEADKQQARADFTEAAQRYGQTFRLLDAPTPFPTD